MYHYFIFNMKEDIEALQTRNADNYGGTKKMVSLGDLLYKYSDECLIHV